MGTQSTTATNMNGRFMSDESGEGTPSQQHAGGTNRRGVAIETPRAADGGETPTIPSEPDTRARREGVQTRVACVGDDEGLHRLVHFSCDHDKSSIWAGSWLDVEGLLREVSGARPDIVVLSPPNDIVAMERRWHFLVAVVHIPVIVVGLSADWESVNGALRAGAKGYLLRARCGSEMKRALVAVAKGEVFLCPVAQRSVVQFCQRREATPPTGTTLTPCEGQVLNLFQTGLSYKHIAECLGKSVYTVANHLRHAREKLHAGSSIEAVHKAHRSAQIPNGL